MGRVGSWAAAAATIKAQPTPGELWAGMASRVGSRVPGLYTLAYPVTGCSPVPDTSRDFNLKTKTKNYSSARSSFQRELTAEGCVQAAHPAWGNTFCILEEKLGWQQSTWELYQD